MSAPNTDLPEDDLDYVGGDFEDDDDDDDDDSEDFVPGEDEVEEHHPNNDVDYDEDEEAVVPLLDGHLFYGTKHALHYQGEGFHLAASEAAPWNLLLASDAPTTKSTTTTSTSCSLIMAGPCDFETAGAKATPRKLKVTFTLSHPPSHSTPHTAIAKSPNGDDQKPAARSTTAAVIQEHEDDDDQKKPSSSSSNSHSSKHSNKTEIYYSVYGTQIDSHGGDLMEFMGGFFPPTTETEKVGLVCQVRMMAPRPSSSTQKASPVAAAAAARVQDDDDDDEEEDAQVDYDELIALHEDAGMSVADLKKRFGSKASASSSPDKKRKFDPKPPPPEDDEDDDDDYGF